MLWLIQLLLAVAILPTHSQSDRVGVFQPVHTNDVFNDLTSRKLHSVFAAQTINPFVTASRNTQHFRTLPQTRACSNHTACDGSQDLEFCLRGNDVESEGDSSPNAYCAPCWRACLECPTNDTAFATACKRCGCNAEAECTAESDCADGTFCSNDNTCKSCYHCINDSDAAQGMCKASRCNLVPRVDFPKFNLPFNPENEAADRYVTVWMLQVAHLFYGFAQRDVLLTSNELFRLLVNETIVSPVVPFGSRQLFILFSHTDTDDDGAISIEEYTSSFYAHDPYFTICKPRATGLSALGLGMADTAMLPGCPCYSTNLAAKYSNMSEALPGERSAYLSLHCGRGYRCSRRSYDQMNYLLPVQLKPDFGVCVPCLLGEFCMEGTVEKDADTIKSCGSPTSLQNNPGLAQNAASSSSYSESNSAKTLRMCSSFSACPEGYYCPDPSSLQTCPAGYFCSAGSIQESSCNYSIVFQGPSTSPYHKPYMVIQDDPEFLIEKLFISDVPMGGNTCPANASNPFTSCPSGSYCPNASTTIICPQGNFCPRNSVVPKACSFLFQCQPGSVRPHLGVGGFFGLLVIILVFPTLLVLLKFRGDQRKVQRSVQDNMVEFLTKLGFQAGHFRKDARGNWVRVGDAAVLTRTTPWKMLRDTLSSLLGVVSGEGHVSLEMGAPSNEVVRGFGCVEPHLSVEFKELTLVLRTGKKVLEGVSGAFAHSQMHAVMGPSGCGKSTFLTALSSKVNYGKITGSVVLHRDNSPKPVKFEDLRYLTGFVPQEDIVHETLTVQENLMFSAKLRLPNQTPKSDIHSIVRGVLELLGLVPIQFQVVGSMEKRSISGGQRKRVNIGMELVAKPSLLFLDEPTSGLDSAVSHDVLSSLQKMAKAGMNIVTVIHQPRYSIFEMFNSVLLLGSGGRTVFLGPMPLAIHYFELLGFHLPTNENPADFYLDVISGAVSRKDDADFTPQELAWMWRECGVTWVRDKQNEATRMRTAPSLASLAATLHNEKDKDLAALRLIDMAQRSFTSMSHRSAFDNLILPRRNSKSSLVAPQNSDPSLSVAVSFRSDAPLLANIAAYGGPASATPSPPSSIIAPSQALAHHLTQHQQANQHTQPPAPNPPALQPPAPQPSAPQPSAAQSAAPQPSDSPPSTLPSAPSPAPVSSPNSSPDPTTQVGSLTFPAGRELTHSVSFDSMDPTGGFQFHPPNPGTSGLPPLPPKALVSASFTCMSTLPAQLTNATQNITGNVAVSPTGVQSQSATSPLGHTPNGSYPPLPVSIPIPQDPDHLEEMVEVPEEPMGISCAPLTSQSSTIILPSSAQSPRNSLSPSAFSPAPQGSTMILSSAPSPQKPMSPSSFYSASHGSNMILSSGLQSPQKSMSPSAFSSATHGSTMILSASSHGPNQSLIPPLSPGSMIMTPATAMGGTTVFTAPMSPARPLSHFSHLNHSPLLPSRDSHHTSPFASTEVQDQVRTLSEWDQANQIRNHGFPPPGLLREELSNYETTSQFGYSMSERADSMIWQHDLGETAVPGTDDGPMSALEEDPIAMKFLRNLVIRGCQQVKNLQTDHLARKDVPWRPRELQAIQDMFDLLDTKRQGQLDMKEFILFWSGLRKVLPYDEYVLFLQRMIHDFNITQDGIITREQFMNIIKAKLYSAAHPNEPHNMYINELSRQFSVEKEVLGYFITHEQSLTHQKRMTDLRNDFWTLGMRVSEATGRVFGKLRVRNVKHTVTELKNLVMGSARDTWMAVSGGEISGRRLPSIWRQGYLVVNRCYVKWFNDKDRLVLDVGIIAFVALAIGAVQKYPNNIRQVPGNSVMNIMAFGVLMTVSGLRTFGEENIIYLQRESLGGLSAFAYVLGKMCWDAVDMVGRTAVYLGCYYFLTHVDLKYAVYYAIMLTVCWYSYGVGYLASVIFDKQVALVFATAFPLIYGGLINGAGNPTLCAMRSDPPLHFFSHFSFTRWAVEAVTIRYVETGYTEPHLVNLGAGLLAKLSYCDMDEKLGLSCSNMATTKFGQSLNFTNLQGGVGAGDERRLGDLLKNLEKNATGGAANATAAMDQFTLANNAAMIDGNNSMASKLVMLYHNPKLVNQQCAPYFSWDLAVLILAGIALRLLTYAVIRAKVAYKAQK